MLQSASQKEIKEEKADKMKIRPKGMSTEEDNKTTTTINQNENSPQNHDNPGLHN